MRNFAQTLLRWEWLVLLLLIPVTLLPFGRWDALLAVIPLFWLLRRAATGRWVTPTPYDLAIVLLLVMLGLSLTVTADISVSGPKIAGIVLGIALLYGTTAYARQRRNRWGLWPVVVFVLLTGTLMAVVGLMGGEWLPPFAFLNGARALLPWPGGVPGAAGGIVNANELAGVLNWTLPLMFGCLLAAVQRRTRGRMVAVALLVPAILFSGFMLVATLSRGGLLAAILGLVLVSAVYLSLRWRLVLVIGLVVGFGVLAAYVSSRLDQNIVGDAIGLSGRLEIWSRALLGIADFPLTGMGVNAFRHVVHSLYPLYGIPADIDLGHAHNHLLQAALDLGLPGLVAYVALWWISAGLLWVTYRRLQRRHATRHPYFGLVAGLAGSLLAGWIFGIVDAVALGARPAFIWWLLLGLTAAVHYAVVYSGESLRHTHRRSARRSAESIAAPASDVPHHSSAPTPAARAPRDRLPVA